MTETSCDRDAEQVCEVVRHGGPAQALPPTQRHRLQEADRRRACRRRREHPAAPRETLGVVGESGCGKSTLAVSSSASRSPPSGRIMLKAMTFASVSARDMRKVRRNIQMVVQDPYTSLNPRMTVGDIIGEPFDIQPRGGAEEGPHRQGSRADRPGRSQRRPHQPLPAPVLGGQRQRIGIASVIALNFEIIVCDEPVNALDVSIQAQVVNLLEKLQDELGLAYIHRSRPVGRASHR